MEADYLQQGLLVSVAGDNFLCTTRAIVVI